MKNIIIQKKSWRVKKDKKENIVLRVERRDKSICNSNHNTCKWIKPLQLKDKNFQTEFLKQIQLCFLIVILGGTQR